MRTYLVRLEGLRLLLVQARDDEHLERILWETGEEEFTLSWDPYEGAVVVQLEVPVTFDYAKSFKVRDVNVKKMFADLVAHVPILGHVRADDPVQAEFAAALLNAACPNAGSVIMAAYRHSEQSADWSEVKIDQRQLRKALREDLRATGQLPARRRVKGVDAPSLNLYWVETDDHDEDWFIVAESPAKACRDHEAAEGYDEGDANAEFVAAVPADAADREEGWPSDELLRACGAVIEHSTTPRVVRFGRRTFAEGMLEAEIRNLDDDASERVGGGRPNGTAPRAPS